jgi:cytochrome c oxidase subunit II
VGSERITTSPTSRRDMVVLFAIAAVATALGIVLGLLIDWFPVAASEEAGAIDTLYDVLIIASVPVFVLVTSVVLYSVVRFRMRRGEEEKDGPPIHGNTRLEVIWTVIPAILMFSLCAYAYLVLADIEEGKAEAPMEVRVVGQQFTWTFYYPPEEEGGDEVASNQLYVPVDTPVLFKVQTLDVLHSFWVPAWRQKIDAVPGIDTDFKVTPNRLGNYEIVCAELCGLGHSVMRQTARVVEQEEFDQWLGEQRAGGDEEGEDVGGGSGEAAGGGAAGTDAAEEVDGAALFTQVQPSCGSCHTLSDAGTASTVGPDLDRTLRDRDPGYIREAILNPDEQLAPGFEDKGGIMPQNYGELLDPAEVDALVEYLAEVTSR